MIAIQSLTKKYGHTIALNEVSLTWQQGECVALIGPNGCGKSTLIKCLLGMVPPTSGAILFDGVSIARGFGYRDRIGYMPQIGRYPDNLTVGQVIAMLQKIRGKIREYDWELYDAFELKEWSHKRMSSLSGGMMQKVSAVLAFLFLPEVLLLDEPTAGLDPLASALLQDKVRRAREEGKLIIITSHLLNELDDMATSITFLQDGNVLFQSPVQELLTTHNTTHIAKAVVAIMKKLQS